MNAVSFFTPIESPQYPLLKVLDYLTWFGDTPVAVHIMPDQVEEGSHLCRVSDPDEFQTNWFATLCKVALLIGTLGLFHLLALLIKVVVRCCIKFHFNPQAVSTPVISSEDKVKDLLAAQDEILRKNPDLLDAILTFH